MSDEIGKNDKAKAIEDRPGVSRLEDDGEPVTKDATLQMQPRPVDVAARKKERLAAALRDNLKRRKAQMRARRTMDRDDGNDSG